MEEREYEQEAAAAFGRVLDLFENVDPDQADVEHAGDVITIDLGFAGKVILNTQRPARQLWLAGGRSAWHFSLDPTSQTWRDARRDNAELFSVLTQLCHSAGLSLPI